MGRCLKKVENQGLDLGIRFRVYVLGSDFRFCVSVCV